MFFYIYIHKHTNLVSLEGSAVCTFFILFCPVIPEAHPIKFRLYFIFYQIILVYIFFLFTLIIVKFCIFICPEANLSGPDQFFISQSNWVTISFRLIGKLFFNLECQHWNYHRFNLLCPSEAIRWLRSGSTLTHVMAFCLMAPSHYLSQCWLLTSDCLLFKKGR